MLQETLGEGKEIKTRLELLLPGWEFETLDALGRLGGLEIEWNTHTIQISNVWGMDYVLGIPLLEKFGKKIVDCKLIDLKPTLLKTTWRNNRVGEDEVAKRMDCFMIADSLMEKRLSMKPWIGSGGIFDHYLILFDIRPGTKKPSSPFKFKKTWLEDDSSLIW